VFVHRSLRAVLNFAPAGSILSGLFRNNPESGFLFRLGGGAGEAIKFTPFVYLKTPKPMGSFVSFFNQF